MRSFSMKKISVIFLLLLSAGLAGCGSDEKKESKSEEETATTANASAEEKTSTDTEEVPEENNEDKEAAIEYLNTVQNLYLEASELGVRWDELRESSAAGELSDYELGVIVAEEIIPRNLEITEEIEAIHTSSNETTELNEILIDALSTQQLAFTEIISFVDTADASKITSANALLTEVRKLDRDFARKIEALIEKYQIEFE